MIEIKKLSKSFESHKVLDSLDLKVNRGTTLVVLGRSGCGKSVLLKHIVGLLRPDSGEVVVNGENIWDLHDSRMDALRMKMGMVFQGGALFDSLTVGQNVGFRFIEHEDHFRLGRKEIESRVAESLEMVGLSGIEDLMPAELSGGMKKRVSLARAICTKPDIILYDEPTTGIDPITSDVINELIRRLHDALKVTSIVVTHDMRSAYKVADRLAMLYKGRIIAEGTPEEIQNTQNPVVYQFINGLAKGPITDDMNHSL